MMKRKQKIGLYDLVRIPVTKIANDQGRPSLKKFAAAYDAEQAEIAQRPIRAAEQKFNALQNGIRSYWEKPISEMKPREAVIDTLGEYALRSGALMSEDDRRSVVKDFFDGLAGNDIFLTPEAQTKFGYFFASLVAKRG